MSKIKEKIKRLNKFQMVLLIVITIIVITSISVLASTAIRRLQISAIQGKELIEYVTVAPTNDENIFKVWVQINSTDGLDTVKYYDADNKEITVNCHNKVTLSMDFEYEDMHDYTFKIKKTDQAETTEILHYECPRADANYILDDGIWVNEPDVTGFDADFTRRMVLNDAGYLTPDTWLLDDENENWFDYKNKKWANICVEHLGMESYYVWIPRYCYKQNNDETTDVKFIDVYNNYDSVEEGKLTWDELEALGYVIPKSFTFDNGDGVPVRLAGFWSMKYIAGNNLNQPVIDFGLKVKKDLLTIQNLTINTTITDANPIVKYQIALEGNVLKEFGPEAFDSDGKAHDDIKLQFAVDVHEYESLINITGLNANGEIVGSMTKIFEPAFNNEPDLTGFIKENTYYVTYDADGNEDSSIPITQAEPADWYDYGAKEWANIVVKANGAETYLVWIPRYEYRFDSYNQGIVAPNQITDVVFIETSQTEPDNGYLIPESFWWDKNNDGVRDADEELSGFWAMKYIVGSSN